jgi:RNA polymerase sigma-B factor
VGDDTLPLYPKRITRGRRANRGACLAVTQEHRRQLMAEYRRTGASRVRDELVSTYIPLARSIAARFQGRGVPLEDLYQVACIGLVMAIDRFDAEQGASFETYLWPTIVGEIKRHFRDCAWHVKVPRRRQELAAAIRQAEEALSLESGRSPSVAEIAGSLEVTEDEVLAAMELTHAYAPASLEQRAASSSPRDLGRPHREKGKPDRELDAVEMRHALQQALSRLDERKQQIVALRYFADQTQRQVAHFLGLSQMQVSRLERQALRQLKELFQHDLA